MNALDHFITRRLRPMAYLRYMDDLTIIESSPHRFIQTTRAIENWLIQNRGLNLNPKKTKVTEIKNEIDYLGYRHKMDVKSGLMMTLPQPKKKWKFVKAAKEIESSKNWERKSAHPLALKSHDQKLKNQIHGLNSRLGGLTKSKSYGLRKETLTKLQDKISGPEIDPDFFDRWEILSIGKKYHKTKIR
jgi:hypothetical protein